MTTPEFSRPVRADQIGELPRSEAIEADPAERRQLAHRFGLVAIDRLTARAELRREAGAILADGRIDARVMQSCVATAAPVPATLSETFHLRFVPEEAGSSDEIELAAGDCDTLVYSGGAIDLGEAAAETLALALDPYPRSPEADAALAAAGVLGEGEAGPFAGLAALKDQLGRAH